MVVYFFGVVTMDFFSHEIYEIYLLGYCQDVLKNNFFEVVGIKPFYHAVIGFIKKSLHLH